jgi:hypothetical protein
MKIDSLQMAILSLLLLGFLYLYNTPTTVYKQTPVYYPVYENRYIPVNRGFRPNRRIPRHHKKHHNNIHQINEKVMGNPLKK